MTLPSSDPGPQFLAQLNAQVVVCNEPFTLAELRCFPLLCASGKWGFRLRQGGRELWFDAIEDDWFFLWIVDVEEGRGRCRVSLPLAASPERYVVGLRQDTLWLITYEDVIEISVGEWKIRSWRSLRRMVPEGAILESAWILPGSHYLWLETSLPYAHYVVDLDAWSLARHFADPSSFPVPVVGSPRPLHGFAKIARSDNLFNTDGSPIPGSNLPIDYMTSSVAYAPNGEGFLSLELVEDDEALYETSWMTLHHLVRDAGSGSFKSVSRLSRRVYDENSPEGMYQLAVAGEASTCFVLVYLLRKERIYNYLFAIALSKRGFWMRYRVKVPYDTVLVQDPEARRVFAIFADPGALHVIPLGRRRPAALEAFPDSLYEHQWLGVPRIDVRATDYCREPLDSDDKLSPERLRRDLEALEHPDRLKVIGHYRAGFHDDVEELVTLYYALTHMKFFLDGKKQEEDVERERAAILDVLRQEYDEHPAAALALADHEALAGRWQEVGRWLDVAATGYTHPRRQHFRHLKALVHLHQGRADEAFAELTKAAETRSGPCSLDSLLELCEPMADPPRPDEWGPQRTILRQLVGAIRSTKRAFEAGDFEGVLAVLDQPLFWQQLEVETAARRAAAMLRLPVRNDADRFRKRFVLARFCQALHNRFGVRWIHLPGVTWEVERIRQVEQASRAWLDDEPAAA